MMKITKKSILSGIEHTMELDITPEELDKWYGSNTLIQEAFPQLNADEREFLMTGITPEEWDAAFGEDDEATATIADDYDDEEAF